MPGKKVTHRGFSYSQENLHKALASVKNGMSQRNASKKYGIPKTTLADRISGKSLQPQLKKKSLEKIVCNFNYGKRKAIVPEKNFWR